MDDIVNLWTGRYQAAKAYRRPIETNFLEYLEQYKGILKTPESGIYKYRSKLFIPATSKCIDGVLAALMMQLFASKPNFSVTPRESQDVEQAKLLQALLEYQFEEADFFTEFQTFLKQCLIYGTSIGRVFWDTQKKVLEPEQRDFLGSQFPEMQPETEEQETLMFDGPVFKAVDIWNFFWDPMAHNLEDGWKIIRYERSIDELREINRVKGKAVYKNLDQLENDTGTATDPETITNERDRKDVMGFTTDPRAAEPTESKRKKVEILECWNEDDTEVVWIGNGRVEIRGPIKNPFAHGTSGLVRLVYTTFPFEFTGVGIPERIADLQEQLNNITNQRNDNINIILNRMWKVQRGAGVDTKALASQPNRIIFTNDMAAIEELTTPMVCQDSYREGANLEAKIEEATGATKFTIGMGQDSGGGTATEAMIQQQSGQSGFALMLRQIESMALKPIIRMFYELNQQMMDKAKVVRIVGPEGEAFINVKPEDIAGNFDFMPEGFTTMMRKEVQVRLMMEFLKLTGGDPLVDRRSIYKKIWEAWGFKNWEEILAKQMPLPPMQPGAGMKPGAPQGMPTGTGMPTMPGMPAQEAPPEEMMQNFQAQAMGGMR